MNKFKSNGGHHRFNYFEAIFRIPSSIYFVSQIIPIFFYYFNILLSQNLLTFFCIVDTEFVFMIRKQLGNYCDFFV